MEKWVMTIRILEFMIGPLVASLALLGLSACSNLDTLPLSSDLNAENAVVDGLSKQF